MPESLRVLGRQRDRWQRGLADVLVRNRDVLLRPRYASLGLISLPYFVFVELLGPIIEMVGLIGLVAGLLVGAVNGSFATLFFLVAYGVGVLLSCLTLVLDEFSFQRYTRVRDRVVLVVWAALESFGYRQLTTFWRLRGLFKYLRGSTDWGVMTRTGFIVDEARDVTSG